MTTQDFITCAQSHLSKFEVGFKDQSLFMKILGAILFFNPRFMTGYATTIGYTVYLPSKSEFDADPEQYLRVLTHEFTHAMDYDKWGILLSLSYLLPQLLGFGALLAVLAIWLSHTWLYALLALVCFAPLPAFFRSHWELRGYTMSAAFEYWVSGTQPDPTAYVSKFAGPAYYYMWAFKNNMINRLQAMFNKILNDDLCFDPPYSIVHNWIQENK